MASDLLVVAGIVGAVLYVEHHHLPDPKPAAPPTPGVLERAAQAVSDGRDLATEAGGVVRDVLGFFSGGNTPSVDPGPAAVSTWNGVDPLSDLAPPDASAP